MTPSTPLKTSALSVASALLLAACNQAQSQPPQPIRIDGSSTVYPITQAVVEEFQEHSQTKERNAKTPVQISVDISGTSGGFRKFCRGETQISGASRPISQEEIVACRESKVPYLEIPVAFDALTVVVNPQNNWMDSITLEELKTLWHPNAEGQIRNWNQIRPSLPDRPINLFGADVDSGTYDYFNEAVMAEIKISRKDYVGNEDDNLTVQAVSQDVNALGYFGLAYYEQNQHRLKALAIDNGNGAILPSRETVADATYQPLGRPLFIYVNLAMAQKNPKLQEFIRFYLDNGERIAEKIGYIPLPEEAYELGKVILYKGEVGTVFGGKSQFDLTLPDMLRQPAKF
ncbi:PstS family phosphate ABC transporter substrate-binding protein [Spirulina subsalsa FACHB-351]|uniref:Phosphate-binding protein n=1 Tax=Spirulina subsalsa FACHB-351 TaxID=234711 RepID=A0ABT3L387_9CYAN|nr:PstS family phosphate ABC transporter substrate-binding protein [Spirulina subsalsa]MCW6035969.1 PstS family phosphate ABC transporter substrate-binding protein [Spirulina subsalsa FACHB-351]